VVLLTDITDRKQAAEALRESEEQLRISMENAPDGVYMNDLEGNFLYGNRKCEEILGYKREELIGKNFLELNILPENSLARAAEILQDNINGKSTGPDELDLIRKDGRLVPVEINTSVLQRAGQRIVLAFARDIAERRLSEEKLEKSYESLKKTLNDAIDTMVKIVEMRDPYTAGHQRKVADLATAIAREMKLEDTRIDQLRIAAVIHDIGKIYVPSDILNKPGKLADMEMQLIKTHSQHGYDIVKDMDFPCSVAKAVLQHHERLDGSGYPNSLKGEDTLLEAKILAVADVIEAMASHRPYRPALSIEKALEEISKNRGRLYDPDVADTCLELFKSGRFEFKPVYVSVS
jgi:PAS domain S-box-containing protein/putative nucleotidyltransferase with HDIG domain